MADEKIQRLVYRQVIKVFLAESPLSLLKHYYLFTEIMFTNILLLSSYIYLKANRCIATYNRLFNNNTVLVNIFL